MATALQHVREPDRVRARTRREINERIDRETEQNLLSVSSADNQILQEKISAVGHEWSFERIVEVEAALTGLAGIVIGAAVDRRFLAIPGFAAAMMLLHATQGWYPLLPLLRRLKVRSQDEIDREYYALKALRGDFDPVADADSKRRAAAAWRAVIQ